MNIAVLLAGGVGQRLGTGNPKQFVELLGRPMIALLCLRRFLGEIAVTDFLELFYLDGGQGALNEQRLDVRPGSADSGGLFSRRSCYSTV